MSKNSPNTHLTSIFGFILLAIAFIPMASSGPRGLDTGTSYIDLTRDLNFYALIFKNTGITPINFWMLLGLISFVVGIVFGLSINRVNETKKRYIISLVLSTFGLVALFPTNTISAIREYNSHTSFKVSFNAFGYILCVLFVIVTIINIVVHVKEIKNADDF